MKLDKKILSEEKLKKADGGYCEIWYTEAICYKCFKRFEVEGKIECGTALDCPECSSVYNLKGTAKAGMTYQGISPIS